MQTPAKPSDRDRFTNARFGGVVHWGLDAHRGLALLGLVLGLHAASSPAVERLADGTIAAADGRRLQMRQDGTILLADASGGDLNIHLSLTRKDTGRWFTAGALENVSRRVEGDAVTLRGRLPLAPDAAPVELAYRLAVSPAHPGRARISLTYETPRPIAEVLSLAVIHIHVPRAGLRGTTVQVDDQRFAVADVRPDANRQTPFGQASPPPARIVLFADNPTRRLAILPLTAARVSVVDKNLIDRDGLLEIRFEPRDNRIEFDVELEGPEGAVAKASAERYAGVDFWAYDRLRVPRYTLSRNLLPNPGFEQGLRYWRPGPLGFVTNCPPEEFVRLDETNAWRGRRSLRLDGVPAESPAGAQTFAIPVVAGQRYTASFHARASTNTTVTLSAVSGVWGQFPLWRGFSVGPEWQRRSVEFTATNGAVALVFTVQRPAAPCSVWVDGVQLEQGALSDYAERPAIVTLVSSARDNGFQPGDQPAAAWRVEGPPAAVGRVDAVVTDLFGRTVRSDSTAFTLDAAGAANLPLPWAGELGQGLFVIESNLVLADGFSDRDFHRLTFLPSLENSHRHKNLFSAPATSRVGDWQRRFAFYRRIGIGSAIHFDPEPHGFHAALADAGLLHFASILDHGERLAAFDQRTHRRLSAAELAEVEVAAEAKARAFPEIVHWKLINEPVRDYVNDEAEMKHVIAALAALRRGIVRATPDARIVSPDPANMYRDGGIQFLDRFLAAGGGSVCDIIAVHPYRPRPEEPDLDADTALLFAMLDRHGYAGDVWFTEGIYHQNNHLPPYGLNVHKGCSSDEWRGGPFSYDLGLAERLCAAYTLRSWLVGLKYGDRVKLFVDWGFAANCSMDIDHTPAASVFACNTLGRLLGNADFVGDVALGVGLRGYVFEDEQRRGVAALWSCDSEVDAGRKPGPVLTLDVVPAGAELLDMAGGATRLSARAVALSSCPVFLRGGKGSAQELLATLRASRVAGAEPLRTTFRIADANHAEIVVRNILSRPITGRMRLTLAARIVCDESATLEPGKDWVRVIELTPAPQGLSEAVLGVDFTPADGGGGAGSSQINLEWGRIRHSAQPPTIDGRLDDWPAGSAFELPRRHREWPPDRATRERVPADVAWQGPADLSAQLYAAWDAECLYLALRVRDDRHDPEIPAPSGARMWEGDGVQLYFDGWADGRLKPDGGYDNNDQVFELWPQPDGLKVNRTVAPEQQLAFLKTGPVPTVRAACVRVPGETLYEIALPLSEIAPLRLEPGMCFGMALLVNDRDGDYRKRGLTLTPAGTEPYMQPGLWPLWILERP